MDSSVIVDIHYLGARTVVRTVHGNIDCFEVKADVHQGSALSYLLFVILMEVISGKLEMPYLMLWTWCR